MVQEFVTIHIGLLAELAGLLALIAVVIVAAGVVIARLDGVPLGEAIYFAFITAFTVGFGDIAPKSRGARFISVLLAFMGVVLTGVFVAVAVHALGAVLNSGAVQP